MQTLQKHNKFICSNNTDGYKRKFKCKERTNSCKVDKCVDWPKKFIDIANKSWGTKPIKVEEVKNWRQCSRKQKKEFAEKSHLRGDLSSRNEKIIL